MSLKNQIMLITYPDSFGSNLKELNNLINNYFKKEVGGIHILPFYPSSGDRGFAPLTYKKVDKKFGSWSDLENLTKNKYLMYDFMVNHISSKSKYFKSFLKNHDESQYADLFIKYKDFWPEGRPTKKDLNIIYKRKPELPFIDVEFEDGTQEKIWSTFSNDQIDLDIKSKTTRKFFKENLRYLAEKGASIIRLDAFAYATKKAGTNCFFNEPEVWELLEFIDSILEPYEVEVLPEIHENYKLQLKLAEKGYWVYDFALPMLVLHSLYTASSKKLKNWLKICPNKQFTTLDTHDGIGVVDVKGLLSEKEIENVKETLYNQKGANVKKIYSSTKYDNLDVYQINCTYYSALGNNDDAYLLARALQFFAPGIPQLYYVGLLAGKNDIELVERTKVGRNINRHNYAKEEVKENLKRAVVKKLLKLMRFRNSYQAFNGNYFIHDSEKNNKLKITWEKGEHKAILKANFETYDFIIEFYDRKEKRFKRLF